MFDHLRSIRNWHYVLVMLALAALAMSVDLANSDRTRKLLLSYLALEDQADAFTGVRIYQDSIDAAIARSCANRPGCPGRKEVQRYMEDLYRDDLDGGLAEKEDTGAVALQPTRLPPLNWSVDKQYTNRHLLNYAERMENLFNMGSPVVNDLSDSLFAFYDRQVSRFVGVNPLFGSKHGYRTIGFMRQLKPGLQLYTDSFDQAEPLRFLPDSIVVTDVSGQRVRLSVLLGAIRSLHIWEAIQDKCYSEAAALVRDRIEQDAINLPIVGLAIRKRSAVLLLMASCLLIALLMRLNLLSANRLFVSPFRVPDIETAYTSAYIGTNASPLAIAINHVLLVVAPLVAFALMLWYSLHATPTVQLIGMFLLSLAYIAVAVRNVQLMKKLAMSAEEHWRSNKQEQEDKNRSETVD